MEILITFGGAVITALCSVVAYLFSQIVSLGKEIKLLRDDHADCKEAVAYLRAQLVASRAMAEQVRLYGGADGADAEVVMDTGTGMILEWSPGAMLLLHWTQREVLGKPFLRLLPAGAREACQAEIAEMARTGRAPAHGPADGTALTREGHEIAVEMTRKGWRSGDQYRVGVTFRERVAVAPGQTEVTP